jgi:hypothetical protein
MDGEKAKMAMTPNTSATVTGTNNLAMGPILSQRRNLGGDQTVETALPRIVSIGHYEMRIHSSPQIGYFMHLLQSLCNSPSLRARGVLAACSDSYGG